MLEAAAVLDSACKSFGALPAVVDLALSVVPVRSTVAWPQRRRQDHGPAHAGRLAPAFEWPGALAGPRCRLVAGQGAHGISERQHGSLRAADPTRNLAVFRPHSRPIEVDLRRRIATLARWLDLEDILDRRCESLSSGEKQRVSLARAVLHDPPVLILDEPTSGLDVLASRSLRDFVGSERARGKAVLFSTHYLAEAELLCDRIGCSFAPPPARGTPASIRAECGATTLEEAS